MGRSYSLRVLVSIVGLVIAVQTTTYWLARGMIRSSSVENGHRELNVAGDIFTELLFNRGQQLLQSTEILVNDFAFRDAVASGEESTIRSALGNHAARVSADYASVFTNKGLAVSLFDTREPEASTARQDYNKHPIQMRIIDGKPYELVVAPVAAPLPIGQASLGFMIDEEMALALQQLTGVDVSFVAQPRSAAEPYIASTLPLDQARHLPGLLQALDDNPPVFDTPLGDENMLTLGWRLGDDSQPIYVILQTPMSDVLAPFNSLSRQLLFLNLGGIGVALLVGLLLAGDILRPLRRLQQAARRISEGTYDVTVDVRGKTEFATLAHAFNSMQMAIKEREAQILNQARLDPLTGLENRTVASHILSQAIVQAQRSGLGCAALTIDIRRFREVNGALGHQVGDELLKVIARRLVACTKQTDRILRLDSDVFLLILPNVEVSAAIAVARRVDESISTRIDIGEVRLNTSAHIGLAMFPDHADDADSLMRRSDIALQTAKLRGDKLAVYLTGSDEEHLRRLELLHDLKIALQSDELYLCYQPKTGLRDSSYIGAEALVRWQHPRFGQQNPEYFTAIAESAGYINALTRWVLEAGIRQLGEWHRSGQPMHLSVNISAHDMTDHALPEYIADTLMRHEVDAAKLCLEITESSIMNDTQSSLDILYRLKRMGIMLSVDDFGTGYSSLSQLKKLPVDELKIDKSFVMHLDENESDAIIVRSTIDLAHSMALRVVAEGVENAEAMELLRDFDCDIIQGYHLGRPMPAGEFSEWLQQRKGAARVRST